MKFIIVNAIFILAIASNVMSKDNDNVTLETTSNENKHIGYKIAGISFSVVGGIGIVTSIPLYIAATNAANSGYDIGVGIYSTFGTVFLGTGILLEGISIPFYLKYHKFNHPNKIALFIGSNKIAAVYDF